MRPRFLIYLSILAIAILAIIFWLRPKGITTPMPLSETVPPTNEPIGHENSASQNVFRVPLPVYLPVNQQTIVTHKVETPEQARQEIESANVPVEFYGKVIDQDSNTLSGVNIKAVVRHWIMADPVSMLAGSKEIPLEQTSGTDGRFELTGATGDGFDIDPLKKDGYQLESGKRGFGSTCGSYDDPVIFKMWSDNIHEKLITGHKSFQIVPDGRPYFINLTDDTISESGEGDLKVWIQYSRSRRAWPALRLVVLELKSSMADSWKKAMLVQPCMKRQQMVMCRPSSCSSRSKVARAVKLENVNFISN